MEEREKINVWLSKNLSDRVAGNKYLSVDQIQQLTTDLTELLTLNDNEAEVTEIIQRGNAILENMNAMINDTRVATLISVEEFGEYVCKDVEFLGDKNPCKNIMGLFDILYTAGKYDLAVKYIQAIDLNKVQHEGIPMWVMVSTNPISPLMRPIPKEEKIKELTKVRCEFYNQAYAFYDKLGKVKEYFENDRHRPADYAKTVAEYDMMYIGGAPKEL